MSRWNHLKKFRIIRLNATLIPVYLAEAAQYRRFDLHPIPVEASTPEEILACAADCDALVVSPASLPRQVIESLNQCQIISRLGAGTDKIDVAAAARKGIVVSNAPAFCVEEMSDHVMALLLSLARQIPRMSRHMYAGAYLQARVEGVRLRRVSGSVLGLVGFGATGKAVARRARAFGLRVLSTRRDMNASRQEADALGVEMVDLETLLRQSDFVSLHLPLTPESYHLLDDDALRKMKPGAYLINTSRGALVDEHALVACLREGRLAGAALDTFEGIEIFTEKEAPPSHPLAGLENVILTPHVSGLSVEALEDVAKTAVENLVSVLSGHYPPPENIVNRGVVSRFSLAPYDPSLFAE